MCNSQPRRKPAEPDPKVMSDKELTTILIVEDDDGHACLIRRHLEKSGAANPVIWFKNGLEAWCFLSGKAAPCFEPDKRYLLILDIRMPGLDGIEVLRRVKAEPRLDDIPVIMLTTSADPVDRDRCNELGCSAFLIKPEGFEEIAVLVERMNAG